MISKEDEMARASRFHAYMGCYTVDSLKRVGAAEFRAHVEGLEGTVYGDDLRQYSHENAFRWGHDHDFGTFQMKGQMGSRHILLLDDFERLGAVPEGRVLDVVLDKSSTHKTSDVRAWLQAHPNVKFHLAATGASWLNMIEACECVNPS